MKCFNFRAEIFKIKGSIAVHTASSIGICIINTTLDIQRRLGGVVGGCSSQKHQNLKIQAVNEKARTFVIACMSLSFASVTLLSRCWIRLSISAWDLLKKSFLVLFFTKIFICPRMYSYSHALVALNFAFN